MRKKLFIFERYANNVITIEKQNSDVPPINNLWYENMKYIVKIEQSLNSVNISYNLIQALTTLNSL